MRVSSRAGLPVVPVSASCLRPIKSPHVYRRLSACLAVRTHFLPVPLLPEVTSRRLLPTPSRPGMARRRSEALPASSSPSRPTAARTGQHRAASCRAAACGTPAARPRPCAACSMCCTAAARAGRISTRRERPTSSSTPSPVAGWVAAGVRSSCGPVATRRVWRERRDWLVALGSAGGLVARLMAGLGLMARVRLNHTNHAQWRNHGAAVARSL